MASELSAILAPRSIAVIGASSNPSKRGYQSVRALVTSGFTGEIYPINRTESDIAGTKVYRSVAEVPSEVDLALVCTPAASLPALIEECGRKGVKGAIILAGGFGETGVAGKFLREQVLELAKRWNIRLIGPNTSGIFNLHQRINLVGFSKLMPGPIGVLSQSGNIALALVTEAAQSGDIGFSSYIGVGNQIDLSHADYLEYFREDKDTKVVVAYIEGFRDGRAFLRTTRRLCATKPLIVYKGGRTASGQRAALSHTGSLAQKFSLTRDLLRQHGAVVVHRTDELLPIADVMTRCPIRPLRRVAVLADGGGHATIAADELTESGFELATLSRDSERKLQELLGGSATTVNPVDFAGAADADPDNFAKSARIILDDADVDALLIVGLFGGYAIRFSQTLLSLEMSTAAELAELSQSSGKPVVLQSLYATTVTEPLKHARSAGLAVVASIEGAVAALAAVRDYGAFRERVARKGEPFEAEQRSQVCVHSEPGVPLLEPDARDMLRANGVEIEKHLLIRGPKDFDTVATVFQGQKLALKIVSSDIPHKSEARGVILNVDAADVAASYLEIVRNAGEYHCKARIEGVLATPMAKAGVELIVGVISDDTFGHVIMTGLGGMFVELLEDVQFRSLPIDLGDALDMLERLQNGQALDGFRGRARVDRNAIAELMIKLSNIVMDNPEICEIDLNPIIARPDGYTIVDSRIIVRSSSA